MISTPMEAYRLLRLLGLSHDMALLLIQNRSIFEYTVKALDR